MGQVYAYPTSDISIGAWARTPAGGDLYTAIDEVTLDTADFASVTSQILAGDPDFPYIFGLGSLTDPQGNTNHLFDIWIARTSGTGNHTCRLELMIGAAVVASRDFVIGTSSPTQETMTLSGAEADSITDYTVLRGRVTLLHDGNTWELALYAARFGVPQLFAHLDLSVAGMVTVAQASGHYLEQSGGGIVRRAGTETTGSLIQSGAGVVLSA
jgi:hypothetical protein